MKIGQSCQDLKKWLNQNNVAANKIFAYIVIYDIISQIEKFGQEYVEDVDIIGLCEKKQSKHD